MTVFTGNTTMLYCPKCRRAYEDGVQRFCANDGGRLLPAPSAKKSNTQTGGVFTNLLGKMSERGETDGKLASTPRFVPAKQTDSAITSFPSSGRIFKAKEELESNVESLPETEESLLALEEPEISVAETKSEPQKPLPRIIRPSEIPSGTASVGDRKTNPAGRNALSRENPDALLGQTVKGRYRIVEIIEEDEDGIVYLAEDKIGAGKKAVVRVFMTDETEYSDFTDKIFAEERVSLSHINHPNIAGVFDSGELPEGNAFIVSEFVEGKSLKEFLGRNGQFNVMRTARIVRQVAYALSEAHQNGILHRNLTPENIVLTVSEAGIEQVKLMNFGLSGGDFTEENLAYKAPEEIEGGISTFASDIYALAVIAYQMLTARLPFNAASESSLLKAQKEGLKLLPTNLRLDVLPLADKILEKALAFNPERRYPKARDFGEAFFNALTTVSPWSKEENSEDEIEFVEEEEEIKPREFVVVPALKAKETEIEDAAVDSDIHISPSVAEIEDDDAEIAEVKATEELAWEKRSPEPPQTENWVWGLLPVLGVLLLLTLLWGGWKYFSSRSGEPANVQPTVENPSETVNSSESSAPENPSPTQSEFTPPPARAIEQPPDTERFQNNRENLKGDLAKNFLGFELYYPKDWTKNETQTNFMDISKRAPDGLPVEQMLITRYESRGTFTLDRPNFPKLVEKSNQDLKKFMDGDFKVISEGETLIQNGRWKVYEVKFQSSGITEKGEQMMVWGRRLWLPVQSPGVRSGFVITMLATSLSPDVKSVDDVGTKGELANILEKFEPEQNF